MPDFRSLPVMLTISVPAPMELNDEVREPDTPETVVMSAMTAVTPIRMPSTVRNERMRLARMLLRDMRTHSRIITRLLRMDLSMGFHPFL